MQALLSIQRALAAENTRLRQVLAEREAALRARAEQAIQGQEADRRRVAHDLHDGVAQLLASAHHQLQTLDALRARHGAEGDADQALARTRALLRQATEEVRRVIAGLRPAELDDLGLAGAVEFYAQSLAGDQEWQVEVLDGAGPARLPPVVEVTAYRIAQEALTNARRHGAASCARVELRREAGALHVTVQDWGCGFDPAAEGQPAAGELGRHVGLRGMRERAQLLGGACEVQSTPGHGATVHATLPLPALPD
ncbi:MAG: sensor histidine kinase [Chloroflexota bacterium]